MNAWKKIWLCTIFILLGITAFKSVAWATYYGSTCPNEGCSNPPGCSNLNYGKPSNACATLYDGHYPLCCQYQCQSISWTAAPPYCPSGGSCVNCAVKGEDMGTLCAQDGLCE